MRRKGASSCKTIPASDETCERRCQRSGPYSVAKGKFFVNVGSVGQPRDGDVRACYVIMDAKTVTFRRVSYNYRKTARKIKRIKRLPNALGARLSLGL